MQSTATTVDDYLETVPLDRISAITDLRQLCLSHLPDYTEGMEYGMPSYSKDGTVEVAFNSQKNYISIYFDPEVLDKYRDRIKDCGKSCIRYTRPSQIDFSLIEQLLQDTLVSAGATKS